MAVFSFVGSIHPMKNDNNGFAIQKYDSGWMNERLKFIVSCGSNSHIVEINAGKWQDDSKNVVYTMSRSNGSNKSEKIQIDWNKRHDKKSIDKVAGWRIMTVDMDTYQNRKKANDSGNKEDIEKSEKRLHNFIAGTDFCEYVNKILGNDKIKDMKFRVNGNVNYTYSAKDDRYYSNYEVNKIYRVENDTETSSNISLDFYFEKGKLDDSDFEETGKALIDGYTTFYSNEAKKNCFCPVTIVFRGEQKQLAGWKKKVFDNFENTEEVRKVDLICSCINGSDEVEITYDMLDDDTKENIDFGLTTLDDVIKSMRNDKVKGDRIQEIRIVKLGKNSAQNGSEETDYTAELLHEKPNNNIDNDDENDDDDLTVDDDDDDDYFDDEDL